MVRDGAVEDEGTGRSGGSGVARPLASLDAGSVRTWSRLVAVRLEAARAELDALNVFPVPDGDTGTNLARSVHGALQDAGTDPVHALLVHARGSSGVIASQLVRGWADVLGHLVAAGEAVTAELVATALRRGDELAWGAVAEPVEGTVLSVSRAAAAAADRVAATGAPLLEVVRAVVDEAEAALARTPGQLPALAAAGVVDAGGAGLVIALRALADVVDAGGAPPVDPVGVPNGAVVVTGGPEGDRDGPGYEVMYLLGHGTDDQAHPELDGAAGDRLRASLVALGDSVVVVGGPALWHVHVHTDEPGAAVEAGLAEGRPRAIRITSFAAEAHAQAQAQAQAGGAPRAAPGAVDDGRRRSLAVVACAAGEQTVQLCRDAGAEVVLSGPGDRAGTGDVLSAVLRAGARAGRVLVLPNDTESAAVAGQAALAAGERGVPVVVGPSRSQVQVLAAVAVLGSGAGGDVATLLRSASDAVRACRHGAVAVAARSTTTSQGTCRAGDLVGTVGRRVVAVGVDVTAVAEQVVEHMLADQVAPPAELLTLLPGREAAPTLGEHLRTWLGASRPGVRVDVLGGGQARYLLLVGCE